MDTLTQKWLRFVTETMSTSTVRLYSVVMEQVCAFVSGPAEDWTGDDVVNFLSHCRECGNSDRTRNTKLQIIRSFHAWAEKNGRAVLGGLPENLPFFVEMPIVATSDEVDSLIQEASAQPKMMLAILLMADAGLRVQEVRVLRWEDITEGVITVHGKGSKVRRIPIVTSRLLSELSTRKGRNSEYVVPGRGGEMLGESTLGKALKRLCVAAGIRQLNPHAFRHRFARHACESGVGVKHIQTVLGHSSLATTDIYLRSLVGDLDAIREGFAQFDDCSPLKNGASRD